MQEAFRTGPSAAVGPMGALITPTITPAALHGPHSYPLQIHTQRLLNPRPGFPHPLHANQPTPRVVTLPFQTTSHHTVTQLQVGLLCCPRPSLPSSDPNTKLRDGREGGTFRRQQQQTRKPVGTNSGRSAFHPSGEAIKLGGERARLRATLHSAAAGRHKAIANSPSRVAERFPSTTSRTWRHSIYRHRPDSTTDSPHPFHTVDFVSTTHNFQSLPARDRRPRADIRSRLSLPRLHRPYSKRRRLHFTLRCV